MTDLTNPSQLEVLLDILEANRTTLGNGPRTFTQVAGSPFTLTANWQKVCTTTSATRGLRLGVSPNPLAYDIEWVSVTPGANAPTDISGESVLAGEDFHNGLPIGDIYCKSATLQKLIVKVC